MVRCQKPSCSRSKQCSNSYMYKQLHKSRGSFCFFRDDLYICNILSGSSSVPLEITFFHQDTCRFCLRVRILRSSLSGLSGLLLKWKATLVLIHINGGIAVNDISINQGIFQAIPCPFFYSALLSPLSRQLNDSNRGYKIHNNVISHTFSTWTT